MLSMAARRSQPASSTSPSCKAWSAKARCPIWFDSGHLVADECHHLSAVSFEAIAREAKARYVLGLSATVARKDGHHPIIFMQCGPVRYRVDAKQQAAERPFEHNVAFRQTQFRAARSMPGEQVAIQELYAQLAAD